MIDELTVLVVVDRLAEVVNGAVLMLGEEVERALDELAVVENFLLEHQRLDSGDLARLAEDSRFEPRVDHFTSVRVGVLALEDLRPEARKWEQRIGDVRREVRRV